MPDMAGPSGPQWAFPVLLSSARVLVGHAGLCWVLLRRTSTLVFLSTPPIGNGCMKICAWWNAISHEKSGKILLSADKWVELRNIPLSEIKPDSKDTNTPGLSFTWELKATNSILMHKGDY